MSEASYVHILSGQKFIESHKWFILFLSSFWKPEVCGQTVLPDRSILIGSKLVENAKIQKRHFGWFLKIMHTVTNLSIMSEIFNIPFRIYKYLVSFS